MGPDFIESLMIVDIAGLLYFQQKLGPVDEPLSQSFISETAALLEYEISAFVLDVCAVCGYKPNSPLFRDNTACPDILAKLQELEKQALRKSGSNGKEACIVRRLRRFFRGVQAGSSRHSLLSAADGPGLAILIWSLGRREREGVGGGGERWLYPTLSYYCAGHVLQTTRSTAEGDAADLLILTTGVAEAELTPQAARRAQRRAAVRLRAAEFALAARAPTAAFALRGFCFYADGRPPLATAAQPDRAVDMEYVLLRRWPGQEGDATGDASDEDTHAP
jgi:hypothetical protein